MVTDVVVAVVVDVDTDTDADVTIRVHPFFLSCTQADLQLCPVASLLLHHSSVVEELPRRRTWRPDPAAGMRIGL